MSLLASLGASAYSDAASNLVAAGGVNIDFDLTFLVQMVIFGALAIVLKPLLFDPVLKLFQERERRTEGARAEAREMQEKAGELLRRYEQEIERVNRFAAEERDRVRAETAKVEAEILQEARATAGKIVQEGRDKMQREINAIQFDLGRQAEKLARDIATSVLGREVR